MRTRSPQQLLEASGILDGKALLIFALFFTILLPWTGAAEQTIQIRLLTTAKVDSESILLGQIAEIQTNNPAQIEALGAVEIGRAPLPGQSLYVHPSRVEAVLNQISDTVGRCQIIAAGPVKVARNHGTVDAGQIRDAVVQYIQTHAPWDRDQMKIRPIRYDQAHIVPPGQVSFQVGAAKHTDWLGAEPFIVRILVNGEPVRRTAVPTYIEVWQNVFLTAKPLGKNQPITQDDIQSQKMDLARLPSNAVVRADQVIGKRANRSIAINTILREDQVEQEPVVRKGDLVQVLAESSLLRVSTHAVAQENGFIGERIALINANSKKGIYAQVVDARTVKVEF